MFDTYTHPSGRIVLKDKELTRIIEERIAEGGAAVYVKGPRQDGFGFKVHYLGADYFVEGAYTWDEEGFDTLAITETRRPPLHPCFDEAIAKVSELETEVSKLGRVN